jgi:hypothetical protein
MVRCLRAMVFLLLLCLCAGCTPSPQGTCHLIVTLDLAAFASLRGACASASVACRNAAGKEVARATSAISDPTVVDLGQVPAGSATIAVVISDVRGFGVLQGAETLLLQGCSTVSCSLLPLAPSLHPVVFDVDLTRLRDQGVSSASVACIAPTWVDLTYDPASGHATGTADRPYGSQLAVLRVLALDGAVVLQSPQLPYEVRDSSAALSWTPDVPDLTGLGGTVTIYDVQPPATAVGLALDVPGGTATVTWSASPAAVSADEYQVGLYGPDGVVTDTGGHAAVAELGGSLASAAFHNLPVASLSGHTLMATVTFRKRMTSGAYTRFVSSYAATATVTVP